jgi:cytochrome c-type biogenesis protein CcmH/NrfF
VIRVIAVVVAALALAPVAAACDRTPSQAGLEGEVMCPVCGTTLDQSESPAAQQIKRVIARDIAAGKSDCEIKDALVANYGGSILAAPRHSGFGLLAWWVPLGGIVLAAMIVGAAAWRWSRPSDPEPATVHALDPALELRLDEELRRLDD